MSDRVDVVRLEAIPPGGHTTTVVAGVPVVVFNADRRLFAVEDECSHEAYPLSDGGLEGRTAVCAQHGARFSLESGEALSAPADEPGATFEVRVRNGEVQMQAPDQD